MQIAHLYSILKIRRSRKVNSARRLIQRPLGLRNIGLGLLGFVLSLVSLAILIFGWIYVDLTRDLPSLSLLPALLDPVNGAYLHPTRFYDRSGDRLLYTLENPGIPRRFLTLDSKRGELFAPELIQAIVGVIEPEFWQSPGINLRSILHPQPLTISEKLVSDLLLNHEPNSPRRAIRMRLLSAQLIAAYGREQALEWFLNSAYFGRLAYGADTASRLYLGKSASKLNHAEAALLAAVLQAPALNPLDAPKAALERQQETLDLLFKRRVITDNDYQRARGARLTLQEKNLPNDPPLPAFFQLATDQLYRHFSRERIERGGLIVTTSLDHAVQAQLDCLVNTQLEVLQGKSAAETLTRCPAARLLPSLPPIESSLPPDLSANGVVVDVKTGEVLAFSGETSLNGPTQKIGRYNPGTLLTPFIATAAFARGYTPSSLVWDIPESIPADLKKYFPADTRHLGPMRLRTALAADKLAPITQVLNQIGASSAWRMAETFGIRWNASLTDPELLFEGIQVSPLEIARAYSVFAAQGRLFGARIQPGGALEAVLILKVEDDDGQILYLHRSSEAQIILSEGLSYLTQHVLSDEAARWSSLGYPNPLEIGRPAGAKLGKTSNPGEYWAAGFTPSYSVAFWLGAGEVNRKNTEVPPKAAAGLWHAIMQNLHRNTPSLGWQAPTGITTLDVCDPSGLLPGSACPNIVSEIFLSGSEPTSPDTLYRIYQVNRETGKLATVFTPPALVQEKVFMQIPPQAREWAKSAGIPLPPETYDILQTPLENPNVNLTSPPLFSAVRGKITLRGSASGKDFAFYRLQVGQGLNPQTWTQIENEVRTPVAQGILGEWDTQGKEGLFAIRLVVVRQDQTVETAISQVTVDNTAPNVRILSPSAGQNVTITNNSTMVLRAEVSDSFGIQRVVWYLNDKQLSERTQPPYTYAWEAEPGMHTLIVKAYDLAGNEGESEKIQFSVNR